MAQRRTKAFRIGRVIIRRRFAAWYATPGVLLLFWFGLDTAFFVMRYDRRSWSIIGAWVTCGVMTLLCSWLMWRIVLEFRRVARARNRYARLKGERMD
ncbi:MAG: hypothetical protein AAGI68_10015 [Planctomycetota bacterium]